MKVKLTDGRTLHMQFMVSHHKRRHVTGCRLELASDDGSESPIEVGRDAVCHAGNTYNKVAGKVLALDRAMRTLRTFADVRRQDRKQVWGRFYRAMRQSPDIQAMSGYGEYL